MGWSHLPAKLVSQLRGIAFGRNILVSLDDQHTHAHTTSACCFESPFGRLIALPDPGALEHWTIGTLDSQRGLRFLPTQLLLPGCDRYTCSCSTNTALPSAVPRRPLPLPALRCAPALLDTSPHPLTPSCFTAHSPRTRALHQQYTSASSNMGSASR